MHVLAFKELLWNTRALICFSNNLSHFMTYGLTSLVCEVFIAVHVQYCVLCYSAGSRCLASPCHVDWHVLMGLNERPVSHQVWCYKAKIHIKVLNVASFRGEILQLVSWACVVTHCCVVTSCCRKFHTLYEWALRLRSHLIDGFSSCWFSFYRF